MQKAALRFTNSEFGRTAGNGADGGSQPLRLLSGGRRKTSDIAENNLVQCDALPGLMEEWLIDGQVRNYSQTTLALRRTICQRLLWFLENQQVAGCGKSEMRRFVSYLITGHDGEHGRWDRMDARYSKPLRPITIKGYHNHLKTFFAWLVAEQILDKSPMDDWSPPQARADQVQPYSGEEVEALLAAAKNSEYPRRNYALILTFYDTGMRTSELCSLTMNDVDISGGTAYVLGKGNKRRQICFGRKTCRALLAYLREDERAPSDAVFQSERGGGAGAALTRSGVRQIVARLSRKAGIFNGKCGGHRLRHTMAVNFLRHGGNSFTLQQLLGHTDLKMTMQYVALADADIKGQHRQFSPADRTKS